MPYFRFYIYDPNHFYFDTSFRRESWAPSQGSLLSMTSNSLLSIRYFLVIFSIAFLIFFLTYWFFLYTVILEISNDCDFSLTDGENEQGQIWSHLPKTVTSRATVEGNLQNSRPRGSFHNWAFFFSLLGYSQEEENKLNMSFLPLAVPLGEWLLKRVVKKIK